MEKRKNKGLGYFIGGTIIILISCVLIFLNLGANIRIDEMSYFGTPAYFIGVLLVAYSIHLRGNKWGWLDFPIALVICIIALIQVWDAFWDYLLYYRLAWLSVFPLNYVALLILFIGIIMKKADSIQRRDYNKKIGLGFTIGAILLTLPLILLGAVGVNVINPNGAILFFTVIACLCIGIYFLKK
ncbi:MAG: hypothetical protein ACFE9Q_08100 [Candidatus Hodarchaeota archaeon]